MNVGDIEVVRPDNYGWLRQKLSPEEIKHLWTCIDNKGERIRNPVLNHITASYTLKDRGDWFLKNTVLPQIKVYEEVFGNRISDVIPVSGRHPYYFSQLWVNYQKQHEFNPGHSHDGVYSFTVWLKIPTRYEEQNPDSQCKSTFQFQFQDTLGQTRTYEYNLNPEDEGMMLFFPSRMWHCVYPFYNCRKDRISVSGNLCLDTRLRM
tara:strand:+ start:204 stop:821 length:618 start_codon:yes stop_codon:yes gene_type:complete